MSKKLGSLIKEARTAAGLTQAQLASKVAGLEAADISKAERGISEPTETQLKSIAKALGVTQASLLEAASSTAKKKETGKTTAKTTAKTAAKPKTSSAGKTSAAKTSSAKTSGKTAKTASGDIKLTAEEKKLLKLYRAADKSKRAMAMMFLGGDASSAAGAGGLLSSSSINSLVEGALGFLGKRGMEETDNPSSDDGDVVITEYGDS